MYLYAGCLILGNRVASWRPRWFQTVQRVATLLSIWPLTADYNTVCADIYSETFFFKSDSHQLIPPKVSNRLASCNSCREYIICVHCQIEMVRSKQTSIAKADDAWWINGCSTCLAKLSTYTSLSFQVHRVLLMKMIKNKLSFVLCSLQQLRNRAS
jgi:hypothetical protein